MSHHEYAVSCTIYAKEPPFYALVMAAMRQADDVNLEKLISAWPGVWAELQERYNSPGGLLPGDDE